MDDQQKDCVTTISKSGRNLLVYIPNKYHAQIGRGDKVKIVLLEKNPNINPDKLKKELSAYLKNPNCEKLKGTVMGYPIEIPLSKLISHMTFSQAEKLFYNLLKNG